MGELPPQPEQPVAYSSTIPVAGINYNMPPAGTGTELHFSVPYQPLVAAESANSLQAQPDSLPAQPATAVAAEAPAADTLRFPTTPSTAVDADHTHPEQNKETVPETIRYKSTDGYFDYVDTYDKPGDEVVIGQVFGTEGTVRDRELIITTASGARYYNKGSTWIDLESSEKNGKGELEMADVDPAYARGWSPIAVRVGRPLHVLQAGRGGGENVAKVEVLAEMVKQGNKRAGEYHYDSEGTGNPFDAVDQTLQELQRLRIQDSPAHRTAGPDQAQRAWYNENRRPYQKELLQARKLGTWLLARVAAAADYAFSTNNFRPNLYGRFATAIDEASLPADLRIEVPSERMQRVADRLREVRGRGAERAERAKNLVQRAGHAAVSRVVEEVNETRFYAQAYIQSEAGAARQKLDRTMAIGRVGLGHMVEAGQALSQEMRTGTR